MLSALARIATFSKTQEQIRQLVALPRCERLAQCRPGGSSSPYCAGRLMLKVSAAAFQSPVSVLRQTTRCLPSSCAPTSRRPSASTAIDIEDSREALKSMPAARLNESDDTDPDREPPTPSGGPDVPSLSQADAEAQEHQSPGSENLSETGALDWS